MAMCFSIYSIPGESRIPPALLISGHCEPDEAKEHYRPGRQFGDGLRAVYLRGGCGPRSWIIGVRGRRQKTKIMNDMTHFWSGVISMGALPRASAAQGSGAPSAKVRPTELSIIQRTHSLLWKTSVAFSEQIPMESALLAPEKPALTRNSLRAALKFSRASCRTTRSSPSSIGIPEPIGGAGAPRRREMNARPRGSGLRNSSALTQHPVVSHLQ